MTYTQVSIGFLILAAAVMCSYGKYLCVMSILYADSTTFHMKFNIVCIMIMINIKFFIIMINIIVILLTGSAVPATEPTITLQSQGFGMTIHDNNFSTDSHNCIVTLFQMKLHLPLGRVW